jgi:hypothetical protein
MAQQIQTNQTVMTVSTSNHQSTSCAAYASYAAGTAVWQLEPASQGAHNETDVLPNSPPSFLLDAELRRIAEPLKQPAAIARWFKRAGFEVKRKPNGMPLVSRVHFERVMHGGSSVSVGIGGGTETTTPDAAALRQRFTQNNKKRGY